MVEPCYDDLFFPSKVSSEDVLVSQSDFIKVVEELLKVSPSHSSWIETNYPLIMKIIKDNY